MLVGGKEYPTPTPPPSPPPFTLVHHSQRDLLLFLLTFAFFLVQKIRLLGIYCTQTISLTNDGLKMLKLFKTCCRRLDK